MAQQTQYTPQGLPGRVKSFSPKTEAVPEHTGLFTHYTPFGIPGARYSFSAKTEADVVAGSGSGSFLRRRRRFI